MKNDPKVCEHDFASEATRAEMEPLGRDYLGAGADSHFSHELHTEGTPRPSTDEAYAMNPHSDSRTRLHTPEGGFSLPPGADTSHPPETITHGRVTAGHPVPAPQHVAYPPMKQTPPPPTPMSELGPSYTTIPLNDLGPTPGGTRANTPTQGSYGSNGRSKRGFVKLDVDRNEANNSGSEEKKPPMKRNQSWDKLAEWEAYHPNQSHVDTLRFAEGDAATNNFSKFYFWALNRNIVTRWIMYIIPILALLWIPGIIWAAGLREAKVWGTDLLWWSIWLTVVWLGLWGAKAAFLMAPFIFRNTIAVIVPSASRYTDVVTNLGRYAKFIVWALVNWVSFIPLVSKRSSAAGDSDAKTNLGTMANLLFGIFLCTVVLGIEKLVIQLIALQFHRDSYADRLGEQKFQLKALTRLYINSHDIPWRNDTLDDASSATTKQTTTPRVALRKALRGLKSAAANTTTALGNVASEMAGTSVLQTNSPVNRVITALSSMNKSRALGRRLFYSFRTPGSDHITLEDIARYFPDLETAEKAFAIFDRDGNGDATRDEIDATMLEIHRDRLSLEASMRDLDGAVGRLDDILKGVVFLIAVLIMATMITTKISTLVTSAGTFILSLSWMISPTMQEVLKACIFLFVKHPYDVGDRVNIDTVGYTVAKMELMSTTFKRLDGMFVWIGHDVLSAKVIENVRRSGATSETFKFDVAFHTSFEKLQALRVRMLKFCKDNSRDFLPAFDVSVSDIPDQGMMSLTADIRYKSNWQLGALKVQRRNKWVCQLKITLAELEIWGPKGAGNPVGDSYPARYTVVPWEQAQHTADEIAAAQPTSPPPSFATATGANLVNRRHDSTLDIWGEHDHAEETNPQTRPNSPGPNRGFYIPSASPSSPVQRPTQLGHQTPTQLGQLPPGFNRV